MKVRLLLNTKLRLRSSPCHQAMLLRVLDPKQFPGATNSRRQWTCSGDESITVTSMPSVAR
jgi:hypothetical protein